MQAVYPTVVFFQLIPKVALAPVFLIWFGTGWTANVLFSVFIAFFPVLVATIILWPLWRAGAPLMPARAFTSALAYFSLIGVGFMMVQIPYMQRFSVYLGHPTYAIANGKRSAQIAQELSISVGTVEAHRRNIMAKLGLHNVAELTKYAVREGLASL